MVLTRSMCKSCVSVDGGSDATPKAGNGRHGMNTVVHRGAARVTADKHASARSRHMKSSNALPPQIPIEDKFARTGSRAAVPKSDTAKRPSGRKTSRGTKSRKGRQATTQSRSSKSRINLAGMSKPIAGGPEEQNRAHRSGKAGAKRKRETDEDECESEAAPRTNARRVRRKVDGPVERAEQCNTIKPETSPANDSDAGSSCQIPRRSARLASKSRNAIPRGQCSSIDDVDRIVDWRNQSRRKRTRTQEQCEDAPEASNSRRIRRRTQEAAAPSNSQSAGRTSGSDTKTESSEGTLVGSRPGPSNADRPERDDEGSSFVPLVKNEDIDQDWLLVAFHERHTSVDSVTSAYLKNRESSELRSSSVESLPTPPPPCTEEDEQVLLHHDFDAMIPLDSIPDEHERDAMNQAYLRQQQDHGPDDEADVEAEMAANRYRSLAPEPDQGLVDAIRSGRIPGLASPERLMREE
ncbi:hypothetical protein ACEPAF_2131 [Sanghuangporus sanghuang]